MQHVRWPSSLSLSIFAGNKATSSGNGQSNERERGAGEQEKQRVMRERGTQREEEKAKNGRRIKVWALIYLPG